MIRSKTKMYRLVNAKNIYCSGLYNNLSGSVVFSVTQKNVHFERISCSFCRKILQENSKIESVGLVRHQSTKSAAALQRIAKKKTKYKKQKKYVELLEVGESTNETKASISKLNPSQLSKFAASSVPLDHIYEAASIQSRKNPDSATKNIDIDYDLLKSFESKFKKKFGSVNSDNIHIEDDKCALIFCNDNVAASMQDVLKSKVYLDMMRNSYIYFRKTTFKDQRFKDLHYAINEGLKQKFDFRDMYYGNELETELFDNKEKGAHEVFRELLNEYRHKQAEQLENELFEEMPDMRGVSLPEREAYDEELHDGDELELSEIPQAKPVTTSKSKAAKQKKKLIQQRKQLQREMTMKRTLDDVEKLNKQEALNRLLAVHLQIHCYLDNIEKGRHILLHYRMKSKKSDNNPKITDINIYNTLMRGYAAKGNLTVIEDLLGCLKEDNITPTIDTYNAIFECIERINNIDDKVEVLRKYEEDLNSKGFSLNDLINKGRFSNNRKEYVLSAIRRLSPSFDPVYTPPKLDYSCPLLEPLNRIENKLGLQFSPIEGLLSSEELRSRAKQQFDIELKGEILVENIELSGEASATVMQYRNKYAEMENEWRESVREAFRRNVSTLKSQCHASHNAITVHPYLTVLQVDEFVELIVAEVRGLLDGSETYSPSLRSLQRALGEKVYSRYQIEYKKRNGVLLKIEQLYDEYCEWFLTRGSTQQDGTRFFNSRQMWQTLIHRHREGASMDFEEMIWPNSVCENVGKFLYKIILNDVKIDVNMFNKTNKPKKLCAVYCVHRLVGRTNRVEVKPHPAACRIRRAAAPPHLHLPPQLAPSIAPPAPRVSATPHAHGGYLLAHTKLIRVPSTVTLQWKRLAETSAENMYPALDSLNQLGNVAWVINKPILDLLIKVFRSGGSKELNIARPPSALDTSEFSPPASAATANAKATAFKRKLAINRARAEMYSLWCDMLYKLSLANHFRDKIFWLPHNMDFRGRAYACPPHLSVLGADSARAMLIFAKKRPLGPDGLRWLKLHAINLTGQHKNNTIDARLKFAESILDKMIDSAEQPLDGEKWWVESEDPWQTLACCIEIANAIKSGNPETYECGFPVQQDGSCNGLQHYASLGADAAGAAAVNLANRDRPQDVYTAVAQLVEEMRERDAAQGVSAAILLEGRVKRKVIKQTVMTTVYGVTRFGARLQIAKQLKELDNFPREHVWQCSSYLTSRTFDSLRTMFTSTKKIQDWFTDCAKLVSGVCGETVEWVTPLGMPVVQPYYRRKKTTQTLPYPTIEIQRPCTMKQRNAFPPNFIHSLDATHMMLTSLGCEAAGLTYASVHDCFWTHPDTVPHMNKICREQFVALHSQPILQELSTFMINRYSYKDLGSDDEECTQSCAKRRVNAILQQVPEKGDFDIRNVLNSIYFFS